LREYDAYGVYPAYDFCQLLEQAALNRLNPGKHRRQKLHSLPRPTVMSLLRFRRPKKLSEDELVRLLDQHPLMKEDKLFQRDLVLELKRQRVPRQEFYRFPASAG